MGKWRAGKGSLRKTEQSVAGQSGICSFLIVGLSGVFLLGIGCSGRNLHRDLREDDSVLQRLWTISTSAALDAGDRGFDYSHPVFFENTMIFGSRSQGVTAIYPGNQQLRWRFDVPGGVISELLVAQGTVFFGGMDGYLYALNAETGRVQWKYEVKSTVLSRATLFEGQLFVTSADDTVYAFDAGTGKWLWHYRRRTAPTATVLGASAPWVDRQEVLVGLSDGFLVALSPQDGSLKWEKKLHQGSKFTDVDASPVVEDETIYVPSYDGALYALKRKSGEVLWRYDAGGSRTIILEDQRIFLPSSDGTIYVLQKSNGKLLWKFDLDRGVPTRLVVTPKAILAASSHQYLYVLDKSTGQGLYRYDVGYGSGFSGSPAYESTTKRVYVLSGAGNLYAFQLKL